MQYIILFFSLINLLLGIIVLMHSKHERDKVSFLAFALVASFWTFNNFLLRLSPDVATIRISYGLGLTVATFGLIWTFFFLKKNLPKLVKFVIVPISALFFFITLFSDTIVLSLRSVETLGYEGSLGSLFYLYSFYISLVFLSIIGVLFNEYRTTNDTEKKKQVGTILAGALFFTAVSSIVSFVIPIFFQTLRFTILDNFSFSIFLGSIVYTILRHRFLDIKIAVTEIFTFLLWGLLLMRVILWTDLNDFLVGCVILISSVIFGIFLIRSVLSEISQREHIEKLAGELSKANTRLKEIDKQKSEFVSFASHQLRSPLTAIKGYASMILEGDFGAVTDGLKDAVEKIFESSKTLANVVDDYLNISRIELGTMKYNFIPLDLRELTENVIGELKPNFEKAGVTLSFACDTSQTYRVNADPDKLKQVIANIIDNSMKYSPKGASKISVSRDDTRKIARFEISDNGIGMSSVTLAKLFNKFTRADNANQTNIRGTGLGLYVARDIIGAHKGKIWAESDGEGKGSKFIFELALI